MSTNFQFDLTTETPELKELRAEVRGFLMDEIKAGTFSPDGGDARGFNKEFSRRVGQRGWIGMAWPKKYGGGERTYMERYVVTEEMRAYGAPTRGHFTADRQSGPVLIRYAQEHIKQQILPGIISGDLTFCIGLSEPNSGSDVFAASTRATKVDGGWHINGTKIWTSNAHESDYCIALIRTSPATPENRRHGLSQFLVPLKTTKGIDIRPIINLTGNHEFNEVVYDNAFLPDDHLIGEKDMAWRQATAELAYERSGPERWLETFSILNAFMRLAGKTPDDRVAEGLGREIAHMATLRRMSLSIAGMLQAGKLPNDEAAVVKDLGTNFEQALPNRVRLLAPSAASPERANDVNFEDVLKFNTLIAPKLTIQGGTREVLRGIIARGLGLR